MIFTENLHPYSTSEQRTKIVKLMNISLMNENYIFSHAEIYNLMSHFLNRLLTEKPSDALEFTLNFFTDPAIHLEAHNIIN